MNDCPRCGGQLSLDIDGYGSYISCFQCGWVYYMMPSDIDLSVVKPEISESGLLYGNGCPRGGTDCFTCLLLPDCQFQYPYLYPKKEVRVS